MSHPAPAHIRAQSPLSEQAKRNIPFKSAIWRKWKYPIHMMGRSRFNQVPTSCNLVTVFCKFCKLGTRAKCYIFSSPCSLLFHNTIVIISTLLPTYQLHRQSQSHLPFRGRHAPSTHSGGEFFIIAQLLLLCLHTNHPSTLGPLSELHHLYCECLSGAMDWREEPTRMIPLKCRNVTSLEIRGKGEFPNKRHAWCGCMVGLAVDLPPLYYFLCQCTAAILPPCFLNFRR